MKIVIFGANGQTGQLLTKQAVAQGHLVTAVTRHPQTFSFRNLNLQVLGGDVFDLKSVEKAVVGQEAVLSTLGVPFSGKPITIYSQGMAHIIQAMQRYEVRRLLCVSSSATNPQSEMVGGFFFNKILQPLITSTIGRTTYEDMRRMERAVMNSGLDWTIVRPSGLFETPTITDYQMAEGHLNGRFTSRADLADCMLQQLGTDLYLHKTLAVATFAVQPNLFRLIMREAFKKPAKNKDPKNEGNNAVVAGRTNHSTQEGRQV